MIDILLPKPGVGPLYMQLYNQLRGLIQDGVLADGMKLPSIRSLQNQLQISKTTVESAYHQLYAEGYIASLPRSGFVVVHSQARLQSSKRGVTNDPVVPHSELDLVDFNLLDVDRETFPSAAWRSALTEALALFQDTLHQYGDPQGEYALRCMISDYVKHSRGVYCTPEQIVIGTGISYRMDQLAMKVFMERGHWYRHLKRIRRTYRKKYERLTQLIKQYLGPDVQCVEDCAGLHIELHVHTESDEETLIQLALTNGVRVYAPQIRQPSNRGYAKIYLGFGGVRVEEMERGILRLKKAWADISTSRL